MLWLDKYLVSFCQTHLWLINLFCFVCRILQRSQTSISWLCRPSYPSYLQLQNFLQTSQKSEFSLLFQYSLKFYKVFSLGISVCDTCRKEIISLCLCVFFSFFILSVAHIGRHIGCGTNIHPSTFLITPQAALFMTIDLHCCLQDMERHPQTPMPEEDMVIYYVNRDFAGWVEQHVRRRVYIELKLECTRNRARDVHKARDDWLCLYCRGYYPSKLRLTDHRVRGCPCGPVDSSGSRCELPVYPNLKTVEQGKVFKLILQRGDGFVWNKLHDMSVWLDLNPELKDVIYPPPGAKVQERRFMEPTLETLTACLAPTTKCLPHFKPRASLPPRQYIVPPASPAFVDLQMTTRTNMKYLLPDPTNVLMPKLWTDAAFFIQTGSLLLFTRHVTLNIYGRMLVEIGMPQTQHELHLHRGLAAKDLLPIQFAWLQSNLADPPQTLMSFCLLPLLLQMCRLMHLYHLISLSFIWKPQQHIHMIWQWNSKMIDKLSTCEPQAQHGGPWRWTTLNQLWGPQYNPPVCFIWWHVVYQHLIWSVANIKHSIMRFRNGIMTLHSRTSCLRPMADFIYLRIKYKYYVFPCIHVYFALYNILHLML